MPNTRIIGFKGGQYGDLCMGVVAAKTLKKVKPDTHFTLGIASKFKEIEPVFYNNPYIDDIHIWEGYEDFPTEKDLVDIHKFDYLFNPHTLHTSILWYTAHHQVAEYCLEFGMSVPKSLQIELNLYFPLYKEFKNYVALSPFTNWPDQKDISLENLERIIKLVHSFGYKTVQLGLPKDVSLPNTERFDCSYFESVKIMASSKLLITADTGMSWVASGYKHPVIGLYGLIPTYPGIRHTRFIEPVNPNATYFSSFDRNDIDFRRFEKGLRRYLCLR